MRKLSIIALLFVMLLGASACGDNKNKSVVCANDGVDGKEVYNVEFADGAISSIIATKTSELEPNETEESVIEVYELIQMAYQFIPGVSMEFKVENGIVETVTSYNMSEINESSFTIHFEELRMDMNRDEVISGFNGMGCTCE